MQCMVQQSNNGYTSPALGPITRVGDNPDSKVHGANMGPTWVLSAPSGPHAGPMDLAISEIGAGINSVTKSY